MDRAPVPKASIDEDRNFLLSKCDIDRAAGAMDAAKLNPERQAPLEQSGPQYLFKRIVPPSRA
jgi:hypothetical protein